jgi:hypothetical protein
MAVLSGERIGEAGQDEKERERERGRADGGRKGRRNLGRKGRIERMRD